MFCNGGFCWAHHGPVAAVVLPAMVFCPALGHDLQSARSVRDHVLPAASSEREDLPLEARLRQTFTFLARSQNLFPQPSEMLSALRRRHSSEQRIAKHSVTNDF